MVCAWVQIAPCDPPPDNARDTGLIAQYLNPNTFMWWMRSMLTDGASDGEGGDWDSEENDSAKGKASKVSRAFEAWAMPTVEEILRAWARDSVAFKTADDKVRAYLSELERRAAETNAEADAKLLRTFRTTWETLAGELR